MAAAQFVRSGRILNDNDKNNNDSSSNNNNNNKTKHQQVLGNYKLLSLITCNISR